MSKWTMGLLSLVLVVVLSACGGESAPPTDTKVSPEKIAPAQDAPPAQAAAPAATAPAPAVETPPVPPVPPADPASVAENAEKKAAADEDIPPPAEGPAPKIVCPEPVYNFGESDSNQKVEHDYVIRNEGEGTLQIGKVATSCGCTVAQPSKKTLAPGEETTIAVTLNLKGRQGKTSKTITVHSNDPSTPEYKLTIEGTAIAAVMIDPLTTNFGDINSEEAVTREVDIKVTKADLNVKITEIDSSSIPQLKTELKEIEPGKQYKLVLTVSGELKEGPLSGRITLKTDAPDYPIFNVNVFGQVIGLLKIAPATITLRYNEDPEAKQSQYLRVSPGRAKEFAITEAIAPIPSMKAEIEPRAANDYLIRLSDMPQTDELDGKELILKTNLPEAPEIKVPFKIIKLQRPRPALNRGGDTPGGIGNALRKKLNVPPGTPVVTPAKPAAPADAPAVPAPAETPAAPAAPAETPAPAAPAAANQ